MACVGRGKTSGRKSTDSRGDRTLQRLHRTSAVNRGSPGKVRKARGPREHYRGHGLRYWLASGPSAGRLGEIPGDGRRRAIGDETTLGTLEKLSTCSA